MSTKIYCWKVVCNYKWWLPAYFVDAETAEDAIEKAKEITGEHRYNYAMMMPD